MGNFLVVTTSDGYSEEARRLFQLGLQNAGRWSACSPDSTIDAGWCQAAHFRRRNGSGAAIVSDSNTGSWLLTIGSWFHAGDYASGEEARLLKRYLEIGPDRLAQELEGFFVIVIGDGRTNETLVLTDLVGSCHGYVRSWKGGVLLSGSSFLLATLGDVDLDSVACQEFLLTGTIYEDRSLYKQIRKLGPAAVYRFGTDGEKSRRYWKIQDVATESLDTAAAVKELAENLACGAKKIGRTFARPVCDLTGGYDSRATVSAFLNAGVAISTTVSGPEGHPDVAISRGLAEMIGLAHLNLNAHEPESLTGAKTAFPFTDGEYDLFEYARVLDIHRQLSKRFDVSINGSYGELARGYWWELLFPHTGARRPLDCRKVAQKRYAAGIPDSAFIHPALRLDMGAHLAGVLERTNAGLSGLPNTVQLDHLYMMVRMQRWQGKIASCTNRLWPCLSPFHFRSVLEAMLRAKVHVRRFSGLIREMLSEYQPKLAAFPLEHGYPAEPLTWKNLHRFWPAVGYYGQRVVSKAARLTFGNQQSSVVSSAASNGHSLQASSPGDEELRDLLCSTSIETRTIVDVSLLRRRLEPAQDRPLSLNKQEKRLVTLEYTLRTLKSIPPVELH